MVRTFACALAAFALLVGTSYAAEGKAKGKGKFKGAHGTLVKYDDGSKTLTIAVGKKGSEEKENKEFKLADDTKVLVFKEGEKKPEAGTLSDLKTAKAGTHVGVRLDDDGKVLGVMVGGTGRRPRKEKN